MKIFSVQKEKSSFRSLRLLMCPVAVITCHVILAHVTKQKFSILHTEDLKQVLCLYTLLGQDMTHLLRYNLLPFTQTALMHKMCFKFNRIKTMSCIFYKLAYLSTSLTSCLIKIRKVVRPKSNLVIKLKNNEVKHN